MGEMSSQNWYGDKRIAQKFEREFSSLGIPGGTEARSSPKRPIPKMIGKGAKRNATLYCACCQDIDHETEDCRDLKEEIESLII